MVTVTVHFVLYSGQPYHLSSLGTERSFSEADSRAGFRRADNRSVSRVDRQQDWHQPYLLACQLGSQVGNTICFFRRHLLPHS